MSVGIRPEADEDSLASKTVGAIVERHDFRNPSAAIRELEQRAKQSKDFGLFLTDSVLLFAKHGAKLKSLGYTLNLMQDKGSKRFDYNKFENMGKVYPHQLVQKGIVDLDAKSVARDLSVGTYAGAKDQLMVQHLFNFYKLALTENPGLKKAITSLKGKVNR